jgi:hypothetical protein
MKPIILDYAIERKGETDSIYEYDFPEALNMLTIEGNKIPFIDSTCNNIAFLTKTKVIQESDDNSFDMLELQTKTDVSRERDDNCNCLLEMQTKTFTQRERDDESFSYN